MALDITGDSAQLAVVAQNTDPAATDWVTADWVRTAPAGTKTQISHLSTEYRYIKIVATVAGETDTAWLRLLLGPSGGVVDKPAGATYAVWAKVTDSPEVPVLLAGTIKVT